MKTQVSEMALKNERWIIYHDRHRKGQGEETRELVTKLSEKLGFEKSACAPTPCFGEYSRASTLSNVDIVIFDKQNENARILCEVEESSHEPKTIIGDIFSVLLSDGIKIKKIKEKPCNYHEEPYLMLVLLNASDGQYKKAEDLAKRVEERSKAWKIVVVKDIDELTNKINKILERDKDAQSK
jgi:hypothetical protein